MREVEILIILLVKSLDRILESVLESDIGRQFFRELGSPFIKQCYNKGKLTARASEAMKDTMVRK